LPEDIERTREQGRADLKGSRMGNLKKRKKGTGRRKKTMKEEPDTGVDDEFGEENMMEEIEASKEKTESVIQDSIQPAE
jgi:hypothetical protein